MPETEAHRRVASRIDAKIKQLEARGLLEVEILRAMAEHMPDFHHGYFCPKPRKGKN